ncbi:MAG TPA: cytochrome c maturation protein CcmE [Acidimicrobiales bacterium]
MSVDESDRANPAPPVTGQAGASPDVLRVPQVAPRDLVPAAIATRRRHAMSRLGVVGVVLAVALGFLIYKAISSAVVYFKTAQEALAARGSLGDSTFQIEGLVVKGSIERDSQGSVTSFRISSGQSTVAITNSAAQPALFQQNVPVVLVGHFVGATNTFASQQILVKHSNSYIAAHPNRVRAPNGSVR